MSLSPTWRNRIGAIIAAAAAVWLGFGIANGELGWPVLVCAVLAGLILSVLQSLPIGTLLLGAVTFGYIVGNRGFAQITLAPNLPLFPAEFVLAVGGLLMLGRTFASRRLPLHRDALNIAILVWIAVASVRLYADVRAFGFMALRDYAMVYYAAFFYLGQYAGTEVTGRRFLLRCLMASCLALGLIFPFFVRFEEFFFTKLTIRGVPLIYLKGDLAGTFLAVGSVLCYLRFETRRSLVSLVLSLVLAGLTLTTDNRASMVGLVAATLLLLLARRWRLAAFQAGAALAAALVILCAAYVRQQSWHKTPVYSVYDRVLSLADPFGQRTYTAEDADKGDNNVFRMLWWSTVYHDTVEEAPLTGLGYGYDLAEHFVQEFYPNVSDDFMARSPHNFVLTVFARTGLIGVLPLLVIVALLFIKTVQTCRADLDAAAPWLACCIVFVSACFGVVLEGPMGAVVFWTALGLANAAAAGPDPTPSEATRTDPHQTAESHLEPSSSP